MYEYYKDIMFMFRHEDLQLGKVINLTDKISDFLKSDDLSLCKIIKLHRGAADREREFV